MRLQASLRQYHGGLRNLLGGEFMVLLVRPQVLFVLGPTARGVPHPARSFAAPARPAHGDAVRATEREHCELDSGFGASLVEV
eukprot:SAG11_NODE_23262_length_392_cov_0.518771_1_plen_83_part_00